MSLVIMKESKPTPTIEDVTITNCNSPQSGPFQQQHINDIFAAGAYKTIEKSAMCHSDNVCAIILIGVKKDAFGNDVEMTRPGNPVAVPCPPCCTTGVIVKNNK